MTTIFPEHAPLEQIHAILSKDQLELEKITAEYNYKVRETNRLIYVTINRLFKLCILPKDHNRIIRDLTHKAKVRLKDSAPFDPDKYGLLLVELKLLSNSRLAVTYELLLDVPVEVAESRDESISIESAESDVLSDDDIIESVVTFEKMIRPSAIPSSGELSSEKKYQKLIDNLPIRTSAPWRVASKNIAGTIMGNCTEVIDF